MAIQAFGKKLRIGNRSALSGHQQLLCSQVTGRSQSGSAALHSQHE